VVDRIVHRLTFYLSGTQLGITVTSLSSASSPNRPLPELLTPALGHGAALSSRSRS